MSELTVSPTQPELPAGVDTVVHGGLQSPIRVFYHSPSDETRHISLSDDNAAPTESPSPSIRLRQPRHIVPFARPNIASDGSDFQLQDGENSWQLSVQEKASTKATQKQKNPAKGGTGRRTGNNTSQRGAASGTNRILSTSTRPHNSQSVIDLDAETGTSAAARTGQTANTSDQEPGISVNPKTAKCSKAEAVNDLLTVCTRLSTDPADVLHWRCNLCKDKYDSGAPQYRNLQYDFSGNTTTMRVHIARRQDHFDKYRVACLKAGIEVHKRAIPNDYDENAECVDGDDNQTRVPKQRSIMEFATNKNHVPARWTREESDKSIEEFILLTDQSFSVIDSKSFRRMLMVQRGAEAKEKDYPHRTKLTQNINQCAEKYVEELKNTLKAAPGRISFTFDGWTSSTLIPIIGVTSHHIDHEWDLRTNVISFAELQGSHSGENIGECLYDIFKKKFEIEDKLMNISSDNVTVNDSAMRALAKLLSEDGIIFDAKEQRSHCFCHVVELVAKAFITGLSPSLKSRANLNARASSSVEVRDTQNVAISDDGAAEDTEEEVAKMLKDVAHDYSAESDAKALLLRIRGLSAKVRRSPGAKAFLLECCSMTNSPPLQLLGYCETRWGSWLALLERLLKIKAAVNMFTQLADRSKKVPAVDRNQPMYVEYDLSETDWILVEKMRTILSEITTIQKQFASEQEATVWRILPALEQFLEQLNEFRNDTEYDVFANALDKSIAILKKYYDKTDNSEVHIVNLYLNASTKEEYFIQYWNAEGQAHARKVFEETFDRYYKEYTKANTGSRRSQNSSATDDVSVNPSPALKVTPGKEQVITNKRYGVSRLRLAAGNRIEREKAATDNRQELISYLADPLVEIKEDSDDFDLIKWWKANASRYPVLATMARDYLAIQGSSVPCERLFSSAALADTDRRNRMLSSTLENIEILKCNIQLANRNNDKRQESEPLKRKSPEDNNENGDPAHKRAKLAQQ